MKDYLYSAFRKVYKTKDAHVLKFIFYENYQLVSAFLMKIFYLEGQILFSFENHTKDVTDEFLRDQKVNTLNKAVNDVQKVTPMSIYYKDSEGKYHWSDETYGIIDREPRVGDEDRHIIFELASKEDLKDYLNVLDNAKPDVFVGEKIFKIETEKGNVKTLKINVHKIYDDSGNLIRISGYV